MAREAFNVKGRLGLDIAQFKTKLGEAAKNLNSFKARVNRISKSVKTAFKKITKSVDMAKVALGALVGAVTIAGFAALTKSALKSADEILNLAKTTASTVEEVQALTIAFKQFGLEGDDVGDVLNTLADRSQDAKDGMQSFIDDFRLIGIEVSDLKGKRPAELFDTFAEAVSKTVDPVKRQAAIVRILGDDLGRKLAPALIQGKEGFIALKEEAIASGAVMSEATVRGAAAANRSLTSLQTLVDGALKTAFAQLGPVIELGVTKLKEFLKLGKPGQFNIIPMVKKAVTAFGFLGDQVHNLTMVLLAGKVAWAGFKVVAIGAINAIQKLLNGFGTVIKNSLLVPLRVLLKLAGTVSEEAKAAYQTITDFKVDLPGINDDALQKALAGIKEAKKELDSATGGALPSAKAAEFNQQLDTLIIKYKNLSEQASTTGKTVGSVFKGWSQDAKDFGDTIQRTLGDELHSVLTGNFDSIGSAFKSLILRMTADAMAADLAGFLGLPGTGNEDKKSGGFLAGAGEFISNFFADGGRPPVGVPSIVGERGKEVFVPDQPGTIIPNDQLGKLGGQTINNVNMTVVTKDAESFKSSRARLLGELSMIGRR